MKWPLTPSHLSPKEVKDLRSRRAMLKCLGYGVLAAPFFRMLRETEALAADTQKKILLVYIPGGISGAGWFPTGEETNFTLNSISNPLADLKNDLLIFSGLNSIGPNNHSGGPKQVFSGGGDDGTSLYSLDQFFGDKLGTGTVYRRVALGLGSTQSADGNLCSYDKSGQGIVTPDDPQKNYLNLFGGVPDAGGGGVPAPQSRDVLAGKKRLLDFAREDLKRLETQLKGDEKILFQSHVTALDELGSEINKSIANRGATGGAQCTPSTIKNQFTGLNMAPSYYPMWYHKPENVAGIAKLNLEMMAQAFACGLTRVGLLQFGASNTQMPLNFEGMTAVQDSHHNLTHAGGPAFDTVQRKMVEQVATLAKRLKQTPAGGGRMVFDDMVIFASSCIGSNPNNHDGTNIPCFLLGSAGGALKTGRYIKNQDKPYNHLLVSIANAMGTPVTTYGNARYSGGLAGV